MVNSRYRTPRRLLVGTLLTSLLLTPATSSANQEITSKRAEINDTNPRIVTEEQAQREYEAYWKRVNAKENLRKPAKPGEVVTLAVNGDLRLDGPYYSYGSGAVRDDAKSGIAWSIWNLFLRVLSVTQWRTAGSILLGVSNIVGVAIDQSKESTAEAYHTYSYELRDGDYFKNGSWYTGGRSERQITYVFGWAMYRDSLGVPRNAYENWQNYQTSEGCHFWDNNWLLGHAQNGYNYGTPMIGESYGTCSIWNP